MEVTVNTTAKQYREANGIEMPRSKKRIYGIKDKKIGFVEILAGANDGAMVRQFGLAAKNKDLQVGQFPEDFELWKLGNLDEETGDWEKDCRKLVSAEEA